MHWVHWVTGSQSGDTWATDHTAGIEGCVPKVKTLFHGVSTPPGNESFLTGGCLPSLFVNKLHFTVDVSQDL